MFMQKIERAFGFGVQPMEQRPSRVDKCRKKPGVWGFLAPVVLYELFGFMQTGLQKIQEEPGYWPKRVYRYTEKVSFLALCGCFSHSDLNELHSTVFAKSGKKQAFSERDPEKTGLC